MKSLNKSDNSWNKRIFIAVSLILSIQADPLTCNNIHLLFSPLSNFDSVLQGKLEKIKTKIKTSSSYLQFGFDAVALRERQNAG